MEPRSNIPVADETLAYALLGLTVVTGMVDAVSFLSLGRVFTANMTGNVWLVAIRPLTVDKNGQRHFSQMPWINKRPTTSTIMEATVQASYGS